MSSQPSQPLDPSAEDALTARGRTIWSGADFLPIARSYAQGAEEFIARLDLAPGEPLLDVACGTGNLALPAARRGARVTGQDIAANLIAVAREEAKHAGLSIQFDVNDAEAMPYAPGQFARAVTMFGAMFTPHPERAAAELLRVTRSGGRVAMANWTPTSFVGHMLRAHGAAVPPPAGLPSPLLWGDEEVVRTRFAGAEDLRCVRRPIHLRFPMAPAAVVQLFARHYGPTVAVLRAASPEGREQLLATLTRLWEENNLESGDATAVASEYLDVQLRVP